MPKKRSKQKSATQKVSSKKSSKRSSKKSNKKNGKKLLSKSKTTKYRKRILGGDPKTYTVSCELLVFLKSEFKAILPLNDKKQSIRSGRIVDDDDGPFSLFQNSKITEYGTYTTKDGIISKSGNIYAIFDLHGNFLANPYTKNKFNTSEPLDGNIYCIVITNNSDSKVLTNIDNIQVNYMEKKKNEKLTRAFIFEIQYPVYLYKHLESAFKNPLKKDTPSCMDILILSGQESSLPVSIPPLTSSKKGK